MKRDFFEPLRKAARERIPVRNVGSRRITKREWYEKGGLANSNLWRRQRRDGAWAYFERVD